MSRADRLYGVFLGSQAVAEGWVTKKQLKIFRRLMHNVYATPGLPADHQLYAQGAALVMPPDAVLGGRSAAAWHGAPFASAQDAVVVLVPPETAWRGPRGVRVHRTEVGGGEVVMHEGIPMTTALRTAWELITLETVPTAVGMLDAMLRTGSVTAPQLETLPSIYRGRWRHSRAEVVLPLLDGRSQSPPESWVRVACARAGLPAPVPQFEVFTNGVFLGQVDLAWPESGLVVEYEGAYHFEETQIVRDDARYRRLIAAGWRVIRLGAADLLDMDALVRRIARALREPSLVG